LRFLHGEDVTALLHLVFMSDPTAAAEVFAAALHEALPGPLRRSQRREQQAILDSVRGMIWYKDAEGKILRCNKAAAQSLGLRVDQVEGRRLEELGFDESDRHHRADLEVVRSGQPRIGAVEVLRDPSGGVRWLQIDRIPFRDESERVAGVVVFAMDVTERKLAEDATRESEKAQRDFVANVSHEFRTPVAAIKGFAETLRRGGLEDRKNRARFVRVIENHANRLQWLIEDLLTLSSLDSGSDRLKLEPLALRPFVAEYLKSVEPLARKARVTLSMRVPKAAVAQADPAYFLQVLENLVGNAIKYNRSGGWVRVEVAFADGRLRLTVRDNGIGIMPSHLPRVFDRFYRVNKGAAAGATGLGLHIVKRIVEAHGGRIWAESRFAKGSAFHVVMPSAAAAS
jgi:two-component system, OmpR family, phosphate regulon sensor histidine kinase PhoR